MKTKCLKMMGGLSSQAVVDLSPSYYIFLPCAPLFTDWMLLTKKQKDAL